MLPGAFQAQNQASVHHGILAEGRHPRLGHERHKRCELGRHRLGEPGSLTDAPAEDHELGVDYGDDRRDSPSDEAYLLVYHCCRVLVSSSRSSEDLAGRR